MKLFATSIQISLFVLTMLGITNHIYAQDSSKTSRILWQRDFGCGDNLSCSPGAATFNKTDNTLLIIGTSFRAERPFDLRTLSKGKFQLWEISQNGERITNTVLKEAGKAHVMNLMRASHGIKGFAVSSDGDMRAIGPFDDRLSFIKTSREGKDVSIKSVPEKSLREDDILILRMINLPEDNSLLIGRDSNENGLIIKVDSEGNRLWKKSYDKGQLEFFTDGVPVGNKGNFLIVGCSANYEEISFVGPSDIWIFRCDARGNIMTEDLFSGRNPRVCQLDSENFVVVYDKSSQKDGNYRIRAFGPDLKVLWEKQFPGKVYYNPYRINAVPGDGFVIAGQVDPANFCVYEYDKEGNKLSSTSMDGRKIFPYTTSLVCTEDKAFIVLQVFSKNKEHRTFEVRVIAIELGKSKK